MPWSRDHKRATRARIVEAAAAAFRGRGLAGVGVAELMQAAGLTHGGFYAHFGSKEALAAEAIGHAAAQTRRRLSDAAANAAPAKRLLAVVETYLSRQHGEHPERGCPVAALGAELSRGEGPAQEAFAATVREFLAWLEEQAADLPRAERQRQAAGALATMVGALTVARAMGDSAAAADYLARVRSFMRACLASERA
ncbi:MAG TPA: TetR/AcrR family transcriptional regulator [Casimicrobiaceae bacterium]